MLDTHNYHYNYDNNHYNCTTTINFNTPAAFIGNPSRVSLPLRRYVVTAGGVHKPAAETDFARPSSY